MEATKHTAGPWRFDYVNWKGESIAYKPHVFGNVDDGEDEHGDPAVTATAVCVVEGNRTSLAVTEANARLIAAAPDLLEACDAARIELMWLIQQVKATPNGSVDRAFQKCKSAIAKATEPR